MYFPLQLPLFITDDYWKQCIQLSQDGRHSAFLLIFISVRKQLSHDRQRWPKIAEQQVLSAHLFHFKWTIRSQQHFKTQFSNSWLNGSSQKAASASLLLLQHSDVSSQNNQSSCSLSLHLPLQDIFFFPFSHWNKDILQIDSTSTFAN